VVERTRHLAHHFHILEEGHAVTVKLLELMERFEIAGKQVHDANIVATMLVHGITQLLTQNIADFSRFSSLITVMPLTLWKASQDPASES
jgi:predicted nucleic acid-binding protein